MTPNTSRNIGWRRTVTGAVLSGALAAGLMAGFGAAPAFAEPETDATTVAQPEMTPDQALVAIANRYDTGEGGGQISKLIHDVMRLRQQGFQPSRSNGQALVEALGKGPSQGPLIEALQATLSFQSRNKLRSEQAASQQGPSSIGIGTVPPNYTGQLPMG